MGLLTNDWGYAVNAAELNPNDPVVNTASEYMYQMATIAYHTLNGTQTVVLDETVTTDAGDVFEAGTYEVPVAGRYWSEFDRTNPIDAKVREQAWTGTAHALIAELGVGSVTASTLQVGLGIAALAAALGLTLILLGAGRGLGRPPGRRDRERQGRQALDGPRRRVTGTGRLSPSLPPAPGSARSPARLRVRVEPVAPAVGRSAVALSAAPTPQTGSPWPSR